MGKYKTSYRGRYRKKKKKTPTQLATFLFLFIFAILYFYAFIKASGIENIGAKQAGDHELKEIPANGFFTQQEQEYCTIRCETAAGIQEMPLEDFLILALSANIDMQYEMETLKAQAVLLRGNCIKKGEQLQTDREAVSANTLSDNPSQSDASYEKLVVDSSQLDFSYFSLEELKLIWGNKYEVYYQKAKEAVSQTKGIYAKSGDSILKGNFHAMSGGQTRSGKEVLGDEAYDYLQSVPCNKNIEDENFLQTKYFEKSENTQLEILERDSAGYVTKVSWNGESYSGEQLRDALGLASANFEIEDGEKFSITTKGIGHGFGFDQYYANYMAKEMGKNYMDLISYFYKDISFSIISR